MNRISKIVLVLILCFEGCFLAFGNGNEETNSSNGKVKVNSPGEFPIVDDGITLTFFAPKNALIEDIKTNEFTKYYEDKTNIHIEWELAPGNAVNEKKMLAIVSGDYPDVFFGTNMNESEQLKYGVGEGIFIPLNDLIEKNGLEIKKMFEEVEYIEPSITAPDGKIYGLPRVNECYHSSLAQKLWINRFWLDKLGLDMPRTTDEFYQVLKAFKEQDPNGNGIADEIPLSGAISRYTNIDGFLMSAFTYNIGKGFSQSPTSVRLMIDEKGKVWAPYITKEWQDGLRYINKLYKEGLIDPAALTQQQTELQSLGENPGDQILGAATAQWFGIFTSLEGENMKAYDALPPLMGPNGFQSTAYYPYSFTHGEFVITDVCENPEAALRYADDLYNVDTALRYIEAGRPDIEWRKAKEGELDLEGKQAKWARLENTYKFGEIQNVNYYQMGPSWRSKDYRRSWSYNQDMYASDGYETRLFIQSKTYEPYAPPWNYVYPPVFPVPEYSDETAKLVTEVNDYLNESIARFIVGDLDIENDWDRYLAEMENIGLSRLIELKQMSYDAQYSR